MLVGCQDLINCSISEINATITKCICEGSIVAKNIDKITEAYNGEFGEPFAKISRDRIHWVCSQAKGEKILDVGCSQGIASIILAREGKNVTGIDICEESIDFALKCLNDEDAKTQANVNFVCTDFISLTKDCESYDCVIMSEVLEHLADPERFIARTYEILVSGGIYVVTVPFGINEYHDHKRTYYLTELYGQICEIFHVDDVYFYDKPFGWNGNWLGIVGRKTNMKINTKQNMDTLLFDKAEKAFFLHEESLIKVRSQLQYTIEQKNENLKGINSQLAEKANLLNEKVRQIETMQKEIIHNKLLINANNTKNENEKAKLQTLYDSQCKETEVLKIQLKRVEKNEEILKLKNTELEKQTTEFEQQVLSAQTQYKDLANSKLGRIQISIWRRHTNKKLKKNSKPIYRPSSKERMKDLLRKVPFLVKVVRKIRGQKVPKQQSDKPETRSVAQYTKHEPDLGYINRIEPLLNKIPSSKTGRYYKKLALRAAIISDEFLFNTFKDVADTVALYPDTWMEQITGADLLFIISGWKGFNEEWRGFAVQGSQKRGVILEIIDYSKVHDIPSVFYSIEDPPHYDDYIEIAKKCDFVFTTAIEMVPNYKKDCGHDNVYALMFGFNPLFHNPVGTYSVEKFPEVVFSGSYMHKYPERCKDIGTIFDGIMSSGHGLKIIDRNYYLQNSWYSFPGKYLSCLSPEIPHEMLQKVHKLYDWSININTVKDSKTMFANRVFELEASGCLQISNYSVGVNSHLPLVYTVQDKNEAAYVVDSLSQAEISRRRAAGIRHAMTGNTCFDRFDDICGYIGFLRLGLQRKLAVVVNDASEKATKVFESQTYPFKELIAAKELLSTYSEFDMIAFMNPDMGYESFYLEDMVNAFKYTDCDYVTKDSYFSGNSLIEGKRHDFVAAYKSKFCTVFWAEAFNADFLLGLHEGQVSLPKGYSIDCLHFNSKPCEVTAAGPRLDYLLSVVVPVYNNGLHLYGKAFGSLQRSSIFMQMEIILVDDGSTDGITAHYVRYLERHHNNVRTYFFNDGGSGSASRPRNKGVELSEAKHVTFLDPDNEAIGDGYARLLEIAQSEGFDLVVGDMIRFQEEGALLNYYSYFKNVYGQDVVEGDKRDFLRKISFTPMSIQGMVIDKVLIDKSGIKQVEGAIGEDSLFSWQLIANANRIKAVDFPVHIYYAQVSGSTVNTINKRFFERSLLIEPARFAWLKDEGLLNDYMRLRFNHYFRNWTMQKLSLAGADIQNECTKLVGEIFDIYKNFYGGKDSIINDFVRNNLKREVPNVNLPYDIGFYDRLSYRLGKMPTSSQGRYFKKSSLRVAIICDTFLYNAFKDAAHVTYLTPSDWKTQVEGCDLLFVAATWTGISNEWHGFPHEGSEHQSIVKEIFGHCKRKQIPTAFYAKEDPPNSNDFIEFARVSDYVFTSCEEFVEKYVHEFGHERVFPLMFGVNPLYHNPVGSRKFKKLPDVIFSGSWMEMFPERNKDMRMLFDGVLKSRRGLRIIDRNFSRSDRERFYAFPNKYSCHVSPSIEHENLQKVHKLYDWAININTIKDSTTMFANRVFELAAAGNLQISNYSLGVQTHAPFVYMADTSDDVAHILDNLTVQEIQERQAEGVRRAMTGNTCFDRFAEVCSRIGLPTTAQNRSIAVVVKDKTQAAVEQFDRQTCPHKELLAEKELPQQYGRFDMVAFFSDDVFYDAFYLEDMVNGFKYTASDYITRKSCCGFGVSGDSQHDFVQELRSKYGGIFWRDSFRLSSLNDMRDGGMRIEHGYCI